MRLLSALKSFTFIFCFITLASTSQVQAQFWNENFGADILPCDSEGTEADGYVSANGVWTVEDTGTNGMAPNQWYISAAEAGQPVGSCNISCLDTPAFNRTLHMGQNEEDLGAIYFEFFAPGISNTDKRAISPIIDCTGQFGIDLTFDYINAASLFDFATVDYFDGTDWQQLAPIANSPNTCAPERTWTTTTIALPASANNNPDVQIGFRWRNNSDGTLNGAQAGHSVAVDNVRLFAGPAPAVPVASFNVSEPSLICEDGCVQYNATPTFDPTFSNGIASATFEWTFPGGSPATSTAQNPLVCYNGAGSYGATLTVTDNIGSSDPVTNNNVVTVEECGPVIAISVDLFTACANEQCFNFTDLSTGTDIFFWAWTFTSPSGEEVFSNEQNPSNLCFTEFGFYDVTLQAIDTEGTTTQTFNNYMQVIDCTGPEVDFVPSRTVICPGECIEFTDLSTSPSTIFAWEWTFPGGVSAGSDTPGTSTEQNPTICFETAGFYEITLAAEDEEGVSAITKTITITVDPCTGPPNVGINSSETEICTGDCVDFFSESLGFVENYLWVFQGVSDINSAVSTERNPTVVCYNTPGTYNVTLTVSNSFGQVDSEVFTNFITVNQCLNPPVPRISASLDTVCAGKCIDFTSVSTGLGITDLEWNFQGGTPSNSTSANPTVCYNTPGTYSVSLSASGAGGDSTRVFNNFVTVVSGIECRPQISVNIPDTICAGDCAFISGQFVDADSISWTFIGGNPAEVSTAVPGIVCFPEIGNYPIIVEAFNTSGAASPVVRNIAVLPKPPLNAGPNVTINAGTPVTLNATIAGNNNPSGLFEWQPFDLVDNFRRQSVITRPRETTTYIVSYQEVGGCQTFDTVTVFVNFVAAVGVPTAFSPNGDGQNDVLRVLGQGITRLDFKVYNRYGQLVFQTTEQSIGWDGTQNGRDLNPGTFVWVLDVRFAEGPQERLTGDVTLVR